VASISTNRTTGNRDVVFQIVVGGKKLRRRLRLGKTPLKDVNTIKSHVAHLANERNSNGRKPAPLATVEWLDAAEPEFRARLVELSLVDAPAGGIVDAVPAAPLTLAAFIDGYIAGRKKLKPSTVAHLKRCRNNIVSILGDDKLLSAVTVGDAKRFREKLAESMAVNTVRRICARAKQFFQAAIDDAIIETSPFAKMKDTTVKANKARDHEITRDVATKILDACPNAEWRLIFALARYGGLRCPSEHFALRWADVDWTAGTMRIDAPKTGVRVMPLFAELRPYLEDAFDPESEFVIVDNRSKSNLRTQLTRIIKKAKVKPWQKLFQNLRATRSTELAKEYGPYAEAEWLGHSPEVAGEFYVRATADDFARAVGKGRNDQPAGEPAAVVEAAREAAHGPSKTGQVAVSSAQGASKNPEEIDIPRGSDVTIAPPVGLEPVVALLH
jgi:integrase